MDKKLPLIECEACKEPISANVAEQEARDLEKFCSAIEYESMSFQDWKRLNRSLDLCIRIFLTEEQLQVGGTKSVTFSRMIQDPTSKIKRKERIEHLFQWPPNAHKNFAVELADLGDVLGKLKGTARLVVELLQKK